jgi:phosphodiesterase/alkaline phosphatase D-like protein
MTLLLVPHEVGPDWVRLWVGSLDEPPIDPASLAIVNTADGATFAVGPWDGELRTANRSVAYRRVVVTGRTPRTRYRFELRRNGVMVSDAIVTTLPDRLPHLDERPFTIMLGSCFARSADGAGNAGRSYSLLPSGAQPDIKILCGDQVYLDQPTTEFLFHSHNAEQLLERHLGNYAATWTQDGGFRELLRVGGAFFSSDDHDYWNNAPNGTIIAKDTWSDQGRTDWFAAAIALYHAFQRVPTETVAAFQVGVLSMCVADTRIHRTSVTAAFMSEQDLQAVEAWAAGLTGPGCLVLGQLVFAGTAGPKGQWTDFGLSDFQVQYARLVRALTSAPHSIVVLTGDVHFGRVAVCQQPSGRSVVEVVSSPLALVSPFPTNSWHAARPLFPDAPTEGVVRQPVQTAEAYRLNANHFATVAFSQSGGFVRMHVQAWPVNTGGQLPAPRFDFEYWIS